MRDDVVEELREQGRGVVGGFLVLGLSAAYTHEIWWFARGLPAWYVLAYAVVGLTLVYVVIRGVGFREDHEQHPRPFGRPALTDFSEVILQSLVAAFLVLFLFGVAEVGDSPTLLARLGLFLVVPFAFGASLANSLLTDDGRSNGVAESFPGDLAVFVLGAVFVAFPIAPTDEVVVVATQIGWGRTLALAGVALSTTFTTLYILEFRGQSNRIRGRSLPLQVGNTFVVYAIGVGVAATLLAAFGRFDGVPFAVGLRETVVLGFASTLGASGARVVIT
ncbi:DUF2391 family protein [Halogeometricum limi]|uniref:Putative integral membrane protein TIGR02587 n=1 Tax=Halogeometricum limi TaxID=555875 RepID=A0A1I6G3H0_9EURY|nr:DUF2391 family protein [Halogeometricum limi]SFR36722.1 putative integral membrane protein TIGR02587 [Halogeometricum limi]